MNVRIVWINLLAVIVCSFSGGAMAQDGRWSWFIADVLFVIANSIYVVWALLIAIDAEKHRFGRNF